MEERLRISEERFNALVQAFPLAIISMDSEGAVTLWNPAAETIFGWSEPEVLGKPLPYVAETMRAEHVALRRRVLSGEVFSGLEVRRQNKGGLPIDLRVSAVPLRDSKGDVCGIMSLKEDITTRKRAEDALLKSEALFNKSQALGRIGSWELDLAANRLTWSDEVYRIFGLRSEAFVPSCNAFLDTVHPDDRETVNAVFSASVREGRGSYEVEHRIVRQENGEVRFVLEKCEHVKDDAGAILRSIGMVQDVTDHRRSEAALRASEERLTQALRAADAEHGNGIFAPTKPSGPPRTISFLVLNRAAWRRGTNSGSTRCIPKTGRRRIGW
ncbi:MAG: PAS domain S-box protein [Desulfobacterales bacterium]|jgi:PAS domain S-box-containing protein|nr:PAS domain S-box protein [Desulfobacterales bacterium]